MNEAIKLAIEKGGYRLAGGNKKDSLDYIDFIGWEEEISEQDILLDPLFWQALGKALGWGEALSLKSQELEDTYIPLNGWRYYANKYFNLIMDSGDTEKFWKELLNGK